MDDLPTKRRRLLQGVSAGGIAFLAGCSEFLDSDDADDSPTDEEDDVAVEPEDEAGDEIPDDEPEDDTDDEPDDDTDDDTRGYDEPDDEPEDDTDDEPETEEAPEEDTDDEMTREVGVIVTLDEEAIEDLEEGIATGEIDQDELVERQREIIEESIDALVEVLGNETDVEVIEEIPEFAAVRVDGRPSELIDVIESEHAQALVPASDLAAS